MELFQDALAVVTGVGGVLLGAVAMLGRIKKARKEVSDVVALTNQLADKYGEMDDDARRLKREAQEAVAAVKAVFQF